MTVMRRMLSYATFKTQVVFRKVAQARAQADLRRRESLWNVLQEYLAKTRSTGCNLTDYWALYHEVRKRKPLEVLECGTGVSTLVIAHALMENECETGRRGGVTSMEEFDEWLDMSQRLLPTQYHPYVDFRLSETVEDRFSLFRGVRYRDVPDKRYDFVFVDGPKTASPEDGTPTFDFDFLHILRTAEHPMFALIDKRVSTCFVLQQVLGTEKARYSPVLHLGFVGPCTRDDLGHLSEKLSSDNFERSFSPIGKTHLFMQPVQSK